MQVQFLILPALLLTLSALNSSAETPPTQAQLDARLLSAIVNKSEATVEECLEAGANIYHQDAQGNSVLTRCYYMDYDQQAGKFVRMLVEKGAPVNLGDCDDKTPLMYACEQLDFATAELLLERGASVNRRNRFGWHAINFVMHDACYSMTQSERQTRRLELLALLRNTGMDDSALSPLMLSYCSLDMLKFLHEQGVDLLQSDNQGYCAFMDGKHLAYFLSIGADVHACTADGWNALHFAANLGDIDKAKLLLTAGADINAQSGACSIGDAYSYKLNKRFLYKPQDIAFTPLMWASFYHRCEMVHFLLSQGADVEAQSPNGITALTLAFCEGYEDIAKALLAAGAKDEYYHRYLAYKLKAEGDGHIWVAGLPHLLGVGLILILAYLIRRLHRVFRKSTPTE